MTALMSPTGILLTGWCDDLRTVGTGCLLSGR